MTKLSAQGKASLDALITKAVEEQKIPGFVFGVSTVDEEIYFNGGGSRIVNNPASGQVSPDSMFWICSQTKLIAHICALQLIEQGRFKQETPVSDFFPEFLSPVVVDDMASNSSSYKPAKTVVLVKHLLNFSSGLFYSTKKDTTFGLPEELTAPHDKQNPHGEFFRIVKGDYPGIPLGFEPGTNFVYGLGSDVLGFIVEKVTKRTLHEYCKENIFEPLGMSSTFYLTPEVEEKLLPITFRRKGILEPWTNHTKLIERDPTKGISLHLGGIGLYSTLRDYLTLLRHLLQIRAGKNVSNPILKQSTVDELFVPTLNDAGSKSLDIFTPGYKDCQWSTALALTTTDWPNMRKKGSAFWSGWAGTFYFMDPTAGVAVVFGTQILPTRDAEVLKLYKKLEEILYSGLEA